MGPASSSCTLGTAAGSAPVSCASAVCRLQEGAHARDVKSLSARSRLAGRFEQWYAALEVGLMCHAEPSPAQQSADSRQPTTACSPRLRCQPPLRLQQLLRRLCRRTQRLQEVGLRHLKGARYGVAVWH